VAGPPTAVDAMFAHTRKYVEEPKFLCMGPLYDAKPLFSPHKACLIQDRPAGGMETNLVNISEMEQTEEEIATNMASADLDGLRLGPPMRRQATSTYFDSTTDGGGGEVERDKQVAGPPTAVDPMFVHTRKYVEEPKFLCMGPLYDAKPLFSPHKACLIQNRPAGGMETNLDNISEMKQAYL
jgi:hypothetical protein